MVSPALTLKLMRLRSCNGVNIGRTKTLMLRLESSLERQIIWSTTP